MSTAKKLQQIYSLSDHQKDEDNASEMPASGIEINGNAEELSRKSRIA